MDILSALLSGQAMTALAAAISLTLVIRNLTVMAVRLPDLRARLDQIESLLEIERENAIAEQKRQDAEKIPIHRPGGAG